MGGAAASALRDYPYAVDVLGGAATDVMRPGAAHAPGGPHAHDRTLHEYVAWEPMTYGRNHTGDRRLTRSFPPTPSTAAGGVAGSPTEVASAAAAFNATPVHLDDPRLERCSVPYGQLEATIDALLDRARARALSAGASLADAATVSGVAGA